MTSQILRLPQAIKKTGVSRSTIYKLVGAGLFPQPVKLSPRTMGFLESEVDAWLEAKAASRA